MAFFIYITFECINIDTIFKWTYAYNINIYIQIYTYIMYFDISCLYYPSCSISLLAVLPKNTLFMLYIHIYAYTHKYFM